MADKHEDPKEEGESEETPTCLQDFVIEQYKDQMDKGKMQNSDVDEERTANFFARALGESQRMNSEVEKSHGKMTKLHDELGVDTFAQWRNEHSSEVLTKREIEAVEKAHRETVAYRDSSASTAT